jgi:FdhE protein
MSLREWDRRIRRATELTSLYRFAAEGLRFYIQVANFQRALYSDLERTRSSPKSSSQAFVDELDFFFLLPQFAPFLSAIARAAPPPLSESARALAQAGSSRWSELLQDFWRSAQNSALDDGQLEASAASERVLAWMFLQPYAERLADLCGSVVVDGAPSTCPICGGRPIVGVLRPEGDGAKKSLICMLCSHEWNFRRVYCPACGEAREPQMAFYSAPEIAHVRVDVCDTCHTYLKAVDLTKFGLAVPVVDELATIPLDLWAAEHGYKKLQTNILGT